MTKIVFVGDSITYGLGLSDTSHNYVNLVAQGLGLSLSDWVKSAVSGYRTTEILTNIDTMINQYSPQHCMIMIGTNDCIMDDINSIDPYVGAENYIQNISKIAGKVTAKITFLSPVVSCEPSQGERMKIFANRLRNFCTNSGYNFIDVHSAFYYYLNQRSPTEFKTWYYDIYHPNDVGHSIIAYYILKSQLHFT